MWHSTSYIFDKILHIQSFPIDIEIGFMCKNRINKDNRCVCRAHQFREGRSANSRSATFERTAKAILREKPSSVPEISGWTLGDCAILNERAGHPSTVFTTRKDVNIGSITALGTNGNLFQTFGRILTVLIGLWSMCRRCSGPSALCCRKSNG